MKPNADTTGSPAGISRKRKVFLPLCLLWAAGLVVWPGCATAPLPSRRAPAGNIQKSDLKFADKTQPSKTEVVARLGKPDLEFPDLRVACYGLTHLSRHRVCLFLGVLPLALPEDNPGLEVVMFQYDAHGNTLRHARRTVRQSFSLFAGGNYPYAKEGQSLKVADFEKQIRNSARQWVTGRE